MILSLQLISIVCSIAWVDCALQYRTELAIKRRVNAFAIGAPNYTELVKKSKIFVDTSLFIEQVLQNQKPHTPVMVMAPNKWGKTINADMLRTFLEIQVDDRGEEMLPKETTSNYRLFRKGEVILDDGTVHELERPLLISHNTTLMDQYQGQMPVIYLDLKHMKGDNWLDLGTGMQKAIREAYRQHDYLLKVYNATIDKTSEYFENLTAYYYRSVFNEALDETKTHLKEESVVFLCKILREHFNRTPFIIVDHFDKNMFDLYSTNNFTRSNMDHNGFLSDRVVRVVIRQNKHIAGALVVTTMHVYRDITVNNYTIKDIVCVHDRFAEYFGINEKDVATLLDQYGITGHQAEIAHKWYRGYETTPQGDHHVYNPISIANFINTKKFATYWNRSTGIDYVIKAKYESKVKARIDLLSLLSKRTIRIRGEPLELFLRLLDLAHFDDVDWRREFFWYLTRMGYLRVRKMDRTVDDPKITVEILNNEIANEISHWLISYYQRKHHIPDVELRETAQVLLAFINEEPFTHDTLQWLLTDLYKRCVYSNVSRTDIERPAHAIFAAVVLKMQSLSLFEIDVHYNKKSFGRYVIANNRTRQGFIVEVSHPSDKHKIPKNDTKYAVEYQKDIIEKLTHLTTMKSVLVEILNDNVIRLSTTTTSER